MLLRRCWCPFNTVMNKCEALSSERNGADDADFQVRGVNDLLQFQLPKRYQTNTIPLIWPSFLRVIPISSYLRSGLQLRRKFLLLVMCSEASEFSAQISFANLVVWVT